MRSSRIARHLARLAGGVAVSAILIGGVAATPASAAHGLRASAVTTTSQAHGL